MMAGVKMLHVPFKGAPEALVSVVAGDIDVGVPTVTTALPLVNPPGTAWNYNSGGITLVAEALGRRFAPQASTPAARRDAVASALRQELFGPLGMTSRPPCLAPTVRRAGPCWHQGSRPSPACS